MMWGIYMDDILEKRKNELIRFIKFKEENDFRYDVVKAFLIEMLPFRESLKLDIEMMMFSQRYDKTITEYSDLLICMCKEFFPQYDSSWIKNFLDTYRIDSYSFATNGSWLLGHNIKYKEENIPLYEEQLKKGFFTSLSDNIDLLGFYAEYLVKVYLASHPEKYSYYKWASQDIGDGLGYDFVAYNMLTKKWDYIEVKSKVSRFDTSLSYNETEKLSSINSNNLDEEYLIFLVPLKLINNQFEHDILECYIDDENKVTRWESLIEKRSDRYIKIDSLEAQEEEKKRIKGEPYQKKINFVK